MRERRANNAQRKHVWGGLGTRFHVNLAHRERQEHRDGYDLLLNILRMALVLEVGWRLQRRETREEEERKRGGEGDGLK